MKILKFGNLKQSRPPTVDGTGDGGDAGTIDGGRYRQRWPLGIC